MIFTEILLFLGSYKILLNFYSFSARRPAKDPINKNISQYMLYEQIKSGVKEAMMAKDKVRLETMRAIVAAFTVYLTSKNRKPNETLTDEEVLEVITKLSKQRKDSIEQYKAGGREDLVAEEAAQLAIFETYLPKLMSEDEVKKIAEAKKAELGITDPTKKGMLMSALMKDLKGKADGTVVKTAVDSLF